MTRKLLARIRALEAPPVAEEQLTARIIFIGSDRPPEYIGTNRQGAESAAISSKKQVYKRGRRGRFTR